MRSRVERGAGFEVASLDLDTIRVERFCADPGIRVEPHVHPTPHFSLVLGGEMSERDGRGSRRLVPGEGRSSPAGDAHDIRLGPHGMQCIIVHADPSVFVEWELAETDGRTFARGRRVATLGAGLAAEVVRADDASPVAIEMLTIEVAALFSRAARGRASAVPSWLSRLRERLSDAPRGAPTLAELAADAGVSRAHVARAFRSHFGCTVGDHLRAIRVERARGLLIETDVPLTSVAYRSGFADQSHMTRELGARLGVTPGRLRRTARPHGSAAQPPERGGGSRP